MAKITSDHIPCRISVSTKIPRENIFRFENFWVKHNKFFDTVHNSWMTSGHSTNSVRNISMKFKSLRAELKAWSRNLSNLSLLINNCNKVIGFLDSLEDRRLLYNTEINLRNLVKKHLRTLLHYKKEYWRKRFTNNKVKFGDECTKFFHSMATISYKRNTITQIRNDTGIWVQDHSGKARLLLNAFKNRMGISSEINQHFDLHNLIQHRDNLEALAKPFLHEEIDDIIKHMPTDKAPGLDGFNGLFMKKC